MFRKFKVIIFWMFLNTIDYSVFAYADDYQEIIKTYGEDNLADKPPFQGGYINFGYWKNIPIKGGYKLTKYDRIKASFDLYKLIMDRLHIQQGHNILEIGCGHGYGGAYVATEYKPNNITCIDVSPYQIKRANHLHRSVVEHNKNLEFQVSSADAIKKPNNYYDAIYSVEAAQYFPSMSHFAKEAHRILKSNGIITITTIFSTDKEGYNAAKKLLPTVQQDVDRLIPIDQVKQAFIDNGFKEIEVKTIGQDVFQGFDLWLSQVEDVPWGRNFYKLYQDQYIDYYILTFKK